jgi:hypothetical protein
VLFCKSQIKLSGLKVDRVFLCGGGAALKGLPEYLRSGMNVPVELFDPFQVVDASALDAESADELDEFKLEAVVALGLATMASDSEAYSVEILPERIVKRRRFFGRTAWLGAAALLALLYLGYDAWKTRAELAEVRVLAQRVNRNLKSATATHKRTSELLEENEKLSELAYLLQGVAGAGEMSARALETLDRTLPGDFWITQLETNWSLEPELGVERGGERPITRLRGKSRQGTEALHTQFQQYVDSLQADPRLSLKPTLSPDGTEFRVDFTAFTLPGASPASADRQVEVEKEE